MPTLWEMKNVLGRIGEWAVTRPAATIAAVVSIVAIVATIGALRLSPDAGTDKLVDNGSAAFKGTEDFRQRFGDDAIVVLAKGDLQKLVLTEGPRARCSRSRAAWPATRTPTASYAAPVCQEIHDLGATRVVFGPATFLNEAATRTTEAIGDQAGLIKEQLAAGGRGGARRRRRRRASRRRSRTRSSRTPSSR